MADLNARYDINNPPFFKYKGDFNKKSIVKNGMHQIHRGNIAVHKDVFQKITYKDNMRHRKDNLFTKKLHGIFNQSYFLNYKLIIYNISGIEFRDNYYNNK